MEDIITRKEFNDYKEKTQGKILNLHNQIQEIEQYRNPLNHEGKFNALFELFNKLETAVCSVKARIASYSTETKFLELFEDNELANLWAQSGLSLKDVADKFKVTIQQAGNYAKGKIDDITTRNTLGKWFREKCYENRDKIKKA